MSNNERWLLPDGIEELLPAQAEQIEFLRRSILKLYQRWGYHYVMTPLVEHFESLLVGTGNDVGQHTAKLVDELTGRLLGVRADITPQVSRIDGHRLKQDGPSRLCYAGPVLLTKPRELGGSRNPIQIGAELYGHAGIESDIEILDLMLTSLHKAKMQNVHLDLGHVGIFRSLVSHFTLDKASETTLFDALQRKAAPEISEILQDASPHCQQAFTELLELHGDETIFSTARKKLAAIAPSVAQAIDELHNIYQGLIKRRPDISVHFDLSELRGYRYHTGVVFAAYVPGYWQAIAQGGRYDDVGKVFGRARPATGYSMDLRAICNLLPDFVDDSNPIFAPAGDDPLLEKVVRELREQGECVVRELPGQVTNAVQTGCQRVLVNKVDKWVVENL